MFRILSTENSELIEVIINDELYMVPRGISVWSALAIHQQTVTRLAPVTEKERSAYCAMGVCFECLVEINGMPNQQACGTEVIKGMQIRRQKITEQTISNASI